MSFAAAVPQGGWLAAGTDVLVPCRCSREVKAAPLSIFPEPSAAELRGGECWLWCHRTKLAEDDQTATIAANQKENSPARYRNDFPVKSLVFAWTRCAAAPTQLMLREMLLLMCSPYSRATQSAKS